MNILYELYYLYNLAVIIMIFNCHDVTPTQLITFVPLYCYDNNITLKMAAIVAETCW